MRKFLPATALLFAASLAHAFPPTPVSLTLNNQPANLADVPPNEISSLTMKNGDLAITFGKDVNGDFSVTSVTKAGTELAHNLHGVEPRDVDAKRSFYLDYGAGRGHLNATQVRILQASPDEIHIAVIDDGTSPTMNPPVPTSAPATRGRGGGGQGGGGRYALEHHFVMRPDTPGLYAYAIVNSPRAGGEMRTMYRFDRDLLDYAWSAERTGQQPKYADLEKMERLQDETWRLSDGTAYQKYDYCAYLSESPMWGHYGHGFGAFLIPASTEYYAGGPFRQELLVHQDALILNYIGGGHFSGGGSATTNGPKMFGPWLLYFNTGSTPEALIADAKKQAAAEQAKWPFSWVNEKLYPTKRTAVTGQLKVADGRSPASAWVILAKPGDVYTQGGDFIFYTHADDVGRFTLPHVRPGTYALHALATQGSIITDLEKPDIIVKEGQNSLDLGTIDWKPVHHNHLLWQIGQSDGMAGEFKFGDQPRNVQWIEQVPANLSFTIGQSKESTDWPFAMAKQGSWDVHFKLDSPPTGNAYLTIALAGGGGGPQVDVFINNTKITQQPINPTSDASTYRAALRSGRYFAQELTFPASLLKPDDNTVRFTNNRAGGKWNGILWDTILLESD